MEERKGNPQDVGNVPDNQKKPAEGEKKDQSMEDRNRGEKQGQGGEGGQDRGQQDKDKKSA